MCQNEYIWRKGLNENQTIDLAFDRIEDIEVLQHSVLLPQCFLIAFSSSKKDILSLYRQEQEALLRAEAEDRCHTLVKKLEFNDEVHTQQVNELRERLEQSQATIISLELRLNEASKNDSAIPDILKQVREQAEMELKRYQLESNETYSRNVSYSCFLSLKQFHVLMTFI